MAKSSGLGRRWVFHQVQGYDCMVSKKSGNTVAVVGHQCDDFVFPPFLFFILGHNTDTIYDKNRKSNTNNVLKTLNL